MKKIFLLIILIGIGFSFGQTKEELQRQNTALKKEIAAINQQLASSKKESRTSIAYLESIKRKITLREQVYENTQKQKRFIEDDIYLRQLEINRQNKELVVLRKNYAKVLINAYKNRELKNKVTFILSARNLGQAIRRIQYLKAYGEYQEKQANKILKAADILKKSVNEREKSIQQKNILLENQQKEILTINAEKIQKEKLIEEFKKNEAKLIADLKNKQSQSKILEGKIRAIINEEIRLAKENEAAIKKAEAEKLRLAKIVADREKARIDAENKAKAIALEKERKKAEEEARKAAELLAKKAAEEKKKQLEAQKAEATARDIAKKEQAAKEAREAELASKLANEKLEAAKKAEDELEKKKESQKKLVETKALADHNVANASNSFAANKGNIAMPVTGNITHRFGKYEHPVFKNVYEENLGIKIAVKKGSVAKCVFEGVVSSVIPNSDGTRTVIVKHGQYFTVYNNLANSTVSKNQQVSAGTPVGTIAEDFDGSYTLDFQIWNGNTPIDPTPWIK